MPRYLAVLTIVLMLGMVAIRAILLKRKGVESNCILLIYLGAAAWFFHRQVLREEDYLKQHYGQEYAEYCRRVRRYL